MTRFFISYEGVSAEVKDGETLNMSIFGERDVWYGEFVPPLNHEGQEVSAINVTTFIFRTRDVIVTGNSICLNISKEDSVELKFLPQPALNPMPDDLNPRLKKKLDSCFVHLFYKFPDSAELLFLSSFQSIWEYIFSEIDRILSLHSLPVFQIKVGIVTAPGVLPRLENGLEFFSSRELNIKGKRYMTIVVSSQPNLTVEIAGEKFDTSKLSTFPRYFAHRAAILLRQKINSPDAKYLRRLLTVAIDNCVALDYFDMCYFPLDDTPNSIMIKSHDFDRAILHIGNCNTFFPDDITVLLEFPIKNFFSHVNKKSNENTLCGAFWNLLINLLFRIGPEVSYRLEWEWDSKLLYPNHPSRKVDLVCHAEFIGAKGEVVSIPVLIVESGKAYFTRDGQHKDTTKLFGLMSANCITLALELIAIKKAPELARVYGMLNGGVKTQLCVCYPVMTQVDGNVYQIHTHISFLKHWELNTFGNVEHNEMLGCTGVCCSPSTDATILESIATAERLVFLPFLPFSEFNEYQVENVNNNDTEVSFDWQNLDINQNSLKKVATFILTVKNRLKLIYDGSVDNRNRRYVEPNDKYYFSQSLSAIKDTEGIFGETPLKMRATEYVAEEPASPTRIGSEHMPTSFRITKTSLKELNIYKKCEMYFPAFFPRISEINRTESGSITYTFEKLLPLFENGRCSPLILSDSSIKSLISSIKFTMDCLFDLHLLHSVIGVIHCDISPVNIMYSEFDMMWKLIDFDLSMDKSECKFQTSRIVGTKGYIAPESEASGIYSEASDVFSLGSVIFDMIYQDLYRRFIYEFGDDDLPSELLKFESIVADMFDPTMNRISVEDALKKLLALLKEVLPPENEIFKDKIVKSVEVLISIDKKAIPSEHDNNNSNSNDYNNNNNRKINF